MVVVEDREPVRRGIVRAIDGRGQPPVRVVGQAENVHDALQLDGFDVALVDLGLPDGRGEAVIRHYRCHVPDARCVVLTLMDDDDSLFAALEAGAQGYILKESKPSAIRDAVSEAHGGGVPLTPRMARFLVDRLVEPVEALGDAASTPLTDREREVLSSLANGLTYAEVASVLEIGIGTVQTHVKNLYRKLEVSSKTEAAAEAVRRGLVQL